jgi:hypothetical protein
MSITSSNGGYGALGFGTRYDHVIARIENGPLTWGGNFQFGNVWSTDGTVTLRTNTTVQGNLTVSGNIQSSTGGLNVDANSTVGGVQIGYRNLPTSLVPSGGNITLGLTDGSKLFHQNGAASTINVPANSSVPFPLGTVIVVFNSSAAAVDIRPLSGVTLIQAGVGNISTQVRLSQWGQLSLTKFDTDRWSVTGVGFTQT